jgi:hypothetical protein
VPTAKFQSRRDHRGNHDAITGLRTLIHPPLAVRITWTPRSPARREGHFPVLLAQPHRLWTGRPRLTHSTSSCHRMPTGSSWHVKWWTERRHRPRRHMADSAIVENCMRWFHHRITPTAARRGRRRRHLTRRMEPRSGGHVTRLRGRLNATYAAAPNGDLSRRICASVLSR